jgi:hypothetical protein
MTTFDDIIEEPDSDELRLELATAWTDSEAMRSGSVTTGAGVSPRSA